MMDNKTKILIWLLVFFLFVNKTIKINEKELTSGIYPNVIKFSIN